MKRTIRKAYLGDSVYAQWDGYHIILTTENGYDDDPRNRIALEDVVIHALKKYEESLIEYIKNTPREEIRKEFGYED